MTFCPADNTIIRSSASLAREFMTEANTSGWVSYAKKVLYSREH